MATFGIWVDLILIIYSIVGLIILFRFKRQQATLSFVVSIISFLLFIVTLSLTLDIFYTANDPTALIGIIIFGIPMLILGFVSTWYKNSEKNIIYQTIRTVTLAIFFSSIIILGSYNTYYNLQPSGVTGISRDQALIDAGKKMAELSESQNNPGMKNAECSITDEPVSTQGFYRVICSFDIDVEGRGYRYLNVNSKDGTVSE